MEVLKLNVSEDQEYEDDYENIEKIQAEELVQIGDIEDVDDKTMSVLSMLDEKRLGKAQKEEKKGGNNKGNKGKNKKNKKKNTKQKKNIVIPNKFGVKIKTYGEIKLFNLKEDPEERHDISADNPEIIEQIKPRLFEHFYHLHPRDFPAEVDTGNPGHWGGYYGPGWCDVFNIIHF